MRITKALERSVENAINKIIGGSLWTVNKNLEELQTVTDLQRKVQSLQKDVETLEISKGRKEEEFAKRGREIEHKVGLERQRQEQEIGLAKREASVEVNEANLQAERDAFTKQMDFITKRFEEEGKESRKLILEMMKRLPSAEIIARIGGVEADKE